MAKEHTKANQARSKNKRKRPVEPVHHGPLAQLAEPDLLALQRAVVNPALATPAVNLALQQTVGNRAVTGLLAPVHQAVVVQRATEAEKEAFTTKVIGPTCPSPDVAFDRIVNFAQDRTYNSGSAGAFEESAGKGEAVDEWSCESLSALAVGAFKLLERQARFVQLQFGQTDTTQVLSAPGLVAAITGLNPQVTNDQSGRPDAGPRFYFAQHVVAETGGVTYDPLMGRSGRDVTDWWEGYVEKRVGDSFAQWHIGPDSGTFVVPTMSRAYDTSKAKAILGGVL